MATRSHLERAVQAIEQHGILLVFPVDNRPEPASLWSVLHPRTEMRWAWDQGADDRVVRLWHLRAELAASRRVVYGKWYRDRAVFFSKSLFQAMLAHVRQRPIPLDAEARELYALLVEDSPQSTKRLRREAGLKGRASERLWTLAMRTLWSELAIVGTGEVEDGAFPSLEVGATRWIFEELWEESATGPSSLQEALVRRHLAPGTAFGKHFARGMADPRRAS